MRVEVTSRDRWLALLLLVAVLALAYLLLVHSWWTAPMMRLGDEIDTLQQRDLRARMVLQQAPAVAARLEQVRAQTADVPGFMPEANVQLANAALVQHLERVVAEASPGNRSCAIRNRTPLADPGQERFPRAAVQVRLSCGNAELAAVLHALESGAPRLFIDNLNILAERFNFAGQGSGGGLDVSFDLYGYLQSPPGEGDAVR